MSMKGGEWPRLKVGIYVSKVEGATLKKLSDFL